MLSQLSCSGLIAKRKSDKRVANLGCGEDTYGTDRVDIKPTSATTLVWDLERGILFPDETFDEVYSKNLLEHLRNVGFFLEECHRALKPNGKLVLVTDNASRLLHHFGTHTGRYERLHEGDHHYNLFTMQHLKNHLSAVGFKILKIEYCDTELATRYLDKALRLIGLKRLSYPRIHVIAFKPSGDK